MREYTLIEFEKVNSTNELALSLSTGAELPIAVRADEQTKGRGRYGRNWFSPRGGLYLSIADRNPGIPIERFILSSLSLVDSIDEIAKIDASIRLPNDIMHAKRKIGGVLVESKGDLIVIGFGLNINIDRFPEDIEATSLKQITGKEFDIGLFTTSVIYKYEEFREKLVHDYDDVFLRWKERLSTIGEKVEIKTKEGEIVGILADVDEELTVYLMRGDEKISLRFDEIIFLQEK